MGGGKQQQWAGAAAKRRQTRRGEREDDTQRNLGQGEKKACRHVAGSRKEGSQLPLAAAAGRRRDAERQRPSLNSLPVPALAHDARRSLNRR